MAVNIGYKQFPEFDVRNDPETVYARFSKYAKRFKDNHLKAYNITDKHQLELKESSQNVTTFSTHIGLYRYKRLNYGTRSAAEVFQETIREELTHDLKGVFNISDDIIVHGRDKKKTRFKPGSITREKPRKECHIQKCKM